MFSIILNCPPEVLILLILPGANLFINWQKTVPSRTTSSKSSPGGNFAPKIVSIHSWASASCAASRLPASYLNQKDGKF